MGSTLRAGGEPDKKKAPTSKPPEPNTVDPVDEASQESFPASDPPALDAPKKKDQKNEKTARAGSE